MIECVPTASVVSVSDATIGRAQIGSQTVVVAGGATKLVHLRLSRKARAAVARQPAVAILRMAISDVAGNVTNVKHRVLLRPRV